MANGFVVDKRRVDCYGERPSICVTMADLTPEQTRIIHALIKRPDGMLIDDLLGAWEGPPPERRTLQRWLIKLIENHLVVTSGSERIIRYSLTPAGTSAGGRAATLPRQARDLEPVETAPAAGDSQGRVATPFAASAASIAPMFVASTTPVPPAPPPVPAPPQRPAPPPLPPEFTQLFASSVPDIIERPESRRRTKLSLQTDAAIYGLRPPQMEAYLPLALAHLDAMTVEQAGRYGATPAQYATWRQVYV
jgi:hypothetical protein